ncbi:MAG: hypothetical protein A2X49_07035 [Lentisphaerae bacterium GWF2_52_8]|nr:MAG: hypothetical protein A2X49_07035 [Lentisphaerae bacterium GWF2_52_8]
MNEWILSQLHPLAALFSSAVILLGALAAGCLITNQLLQGRPRHKADVLLVSLPIGLGTMSLFFLVAGSMGIITPSSAWAINSIASLSGLLYLWKVGKLPGIRRVKRDLIFFIPLSFVMLLSLGSAFCPPTGWDELTYHIALPLRWTQDHAPLVYPDNPYSGFPGASEILFWISYMMGGLSAPRLLNWVLFAWTANMLYRLFRPGLAPLKSSILTWALLLAPVSLMVFKEGYSEPLLLLGFVTGIFICKRASWNCVPWRLAVLCGCLAGLLVSIKLTGLFAAGALLLLMPVWKQSWRKAFLPVFVFCAILLLFAIPFYLRPYLATGNPFHPYFAQYFSSEPAALQSSLFQHAIGAAKYGLQTMQGFLMDPIMLAFEERTFDGSFGFQYLLLLILGIFSLRTDREKSVGRKILPLLAAALLLYVSWFFTAQQARFLLPLLPVLALLAVFGLKRISNPKLLALCFAALATLSIISMPGKAILHHWQGWRVQLGLSQPADYVYSGTGEGYLQAAEMSRRLVPKDGSLLLLLEERILYFPQNSFIGTPFVQSRFFTPPPKFSDGPLAILKTLHDNGITHVLIALNPAHPDRLPDYLAQLEDFSRLLGSLVESGDLKEIWQGSNYVLYSLR